MTTMAALYDTDFHAWAEWQAAALRALALERPNLPIDLEHLIEEVEDLGKRERDAVFSLAELILRHLLLLRWSRATEPQRHRREEVLTHRVRLRRKLTPSLRRHLESQLAEVYADARVLASAKLELHGEADVAAMLPEVLPYSLDELLGDEPS